MWKQYGNDAFKKQDWNRAIGHYTKAIGISFIFTSLPSFALSHISSFHFCSQSFTVVIFFLSFCLWRLDSGGYIFSNLLFATEIVGDSEKLPTYYGNRAQTFLKKGFYRECISDCLKGKELDKSSTKASPVFLRYTFPNLLIVVSAARHCPFAAGRVSKGCS